MVGFLECFQFVWGQVDKNNKDDNDDEEEWDVKAIVRKRIAKLRQGHTTVGGWKLTLLEDLLGYKGNLLGS